MFKIFLRPALVALGSGLLLAMPAQACSTCKCGDYTITLQGTEKPYAGRLRAAVTSLWREESQGAGLGERRTEEWRSTLGASYSLTDDLTLAAELPWVRKRVSDGNLASQTAEGIGDADLTAWWVLYRSSETVTQHLAGLRLGARLPTSEQVRANGRLVDIDAQPDAGAWAPTLGGWYRHYRFPWMLSVSGAYYAYQDGRQGFAPGDAWVATLLTQYAVSQTWALRAGIDGRYAGRNQFSGVTDPNSGGSLAALQAGVAARFFHELVLSAGIQVPVWDGLNGEQAEQESLRLALAYDF